MLFSGSRVIGGGGGIEFWMHSQMGTRYFVRFSASGFTGACLECWTMAEQSFVRCQGLASRYPEGLVSTCDLMAGHLTSPIFMSDLVDLVSFYFYYHFRLVLSFLVQDPPQWDLEAE